MWQTDNSVRSRNVRSEYRSRKGGRDIGPTATAAGSAIDDRIRRLGGESAGIDRSPSRWVGNQGAKHRMVELVATAHGPVGPDQWQARQGEIANRIKRLVTHEFISEAQTFSIEHPVLRYHDRVVEGGAERMAGAPQLGDVVHKAEGTGAGDFLSERFRRDVEGYRLPSDQRIVECNFDFKAKASRIGPQLTEAVASGDANGLENPNVTTRRRKRRDADLFDCRDKRRGASVHDRHFGAVDFNYGVVDAKSGQRGQHMLRRRTQRAFGVSQHSGKLGGRNSAHIGTHFTVRTAVDSTAKECNAAIDFGRMDCQRDRQSRVNPNTRKGCTIAQRRLPGGFHVQPFQPQIPVLPQTSGNRTPTALMAKPLSARPIAVRIWTKVRMSRLALRPPTRYPRPLDSEHLSRPRGCHQLTLFYQLLLGFRLNYSIRGSHAAARGESDGKRNTIGLSKSLSETFLRGSPVDAKTPEYRVGRPQAVNASVQRDRARPPAACPAWQTQELVLSHAIRETFRVRGVPAAPAPPHAPTPRGEHRIYGRVRRPGAPARPGP